MWPDAAESLADFLVQWSTGTAYLDDVDPSRLEPHDRVSHDLALSTSAFEFTRALVRLQTASRAFVGPFGGSGANDIDVLVTPTMTCLPPEVGAWRVGCDEDPNMAMVNCTPMAANTVIANLTGLPALSLPLHRSDSGLPVGVQFIAPPWSDALLLRLGSQIEVAAPWIDRRPDVTRLISPH